MKPLTLNDPETRSTDVKAQQLREAFDTLDKRTAMQRFPELTRLYPLVAEATRFAREKMPDPANRAAFVEQIKERGIQELARGEPLPCAWPGK